MGDVLWIEPVIRALADRHDKVRVHTRYNELFLNYPLPNVSFFSGLSFFQKILIRIDKALGTRLFSIDLDGSYEASPHRHFLEAYQASAGLPPTREYPRLYLSEKERCMDPGITGPFVLLHLESLTDKNYRKAYGINWAAVADRLSRDGYTVLQLGKDPVPIKGVIHRPTSLREMMALLAKASLFIGLDSGPSHLAAALGVPSILLFGAVNPAYRHFPELLKGIILQEPCPYAGCFHEAPNPEKMICRLVGEDGIPICCAFTTEKVLEAIDQLKQRT